jgi:hypothetical protein
MDRSKVEPSRKLAASPATLSSSGPAARLAKGPATSVQMEVASNAARPGLLGKLPNELLVRILKLCKADRGKFFDGNSTLASLARTCRFLNEMATPLLYAEIHLEEHYNPLYRTLSSDRGSVLRQHCKSLIFGSWSWRTDYSGRNWEEKLTGTPGGFNGQGCTRFSEILGWKFPKATRLAIRVEDWWPLLPEAARPPTGLGRPKAFLTRVLLEILGNMPNLRQLELERPDGYWTCPDGFGVTHDFPLSTILREAPKVLPALRSFRSDVVFDEDFEQDALYELQVRLVD